MNFAQEICHITGLRAAGSKLNQITYGGVYYPAHTKNGKPIGARWEGVFFINRRGYTDSNGTQHEGSSDTIKVVVWNSRNSKPGKGYADLMAKTISVGKEISASFDIRTFEKRIFVNNVAITDPQGNAVTVSAVNFVMKDHFALGADSDAVIKAETGRYTGQVNFASRPPQWNQPGTPDHAKWTTEILTARMTSVYNGSNASYGYARVLVTEGCTVLTHDQYQAAIGQQNVAGQSPTNAAAGLEEDLNNGGGGQQGPPADEGATMPL